MEVIIWALGILLAIAFAIIIRQALENDRQNIRLSRIESEIKIQDETNPAPYSIRIYSEPSRFQKLERRISHVELDIKRLPYTKLKEAERLSLAAKTIIDEVGKSNA